MTDDSINCRRTPSGGRGRLRVPRVSRVLPHDAQEAQRHRPGERAQGDL